MRRFTGTRVLGAALAILVGAGAAAVPTALAGQARGELAVMVQVIAPCRASFAGNALSQDCGTQAPHLLETGPPSLPPAPEAASTPHGRDSGAAVVTGPTYVTVVY